jgi:DNA-binding MarR family transcriptional regulator
MVAMPVPSRSHLAAEAWRRMFGFFIRTRAQRDQVLSRHGLTPNDIRALGSIGMHGDRTMRSLSDEWCCDASNATWIVDRLERRGLVARTTPEADRRVKHVVLTAAGKRLKHRILKDLYHAPPELLALDTARLAALRDALAALPALPGDANPTTHLTPPTRFSKANGRSRRPARPRAASKGNR